MGDSAWRPPIGLRCAYQGHAGEICATYPAGDGYHVVMRFDVPIGGCVSTHYVGPIEACTPIVRQAA